MCIALSAGAATAARAESNADEEEETASDSELMLKALTAERGETPNARRIERASAQARVESLRRRSTTVVTMWKDPFAEDPERPVAVRMPAPKKRRGGGGDDVTAMRRELARARAETAAAQAAAAAAQAEAARAKANSARAEAEAARIQAVAARQEAAAARAECVASDRPKRSGRVRAPDGRDGLGRFAVPRGGRSEPSGPRLAASKTRPQPKSGRKIPASFTEPAAPVDDPPAPPPATDPPPPPLGRIIVVPITR